MKALHLEGWLIWQGPLWNVGLRSETEMKERMSLTLGEDAFAGFEQKFYDEFITEADVIKIKSLGFNTIRLSFNHSILEKDNRPYVYREQGWKQLDRFLDYAEKHNIYVMLTMHSAPGGQSNLFVCDPDDTLLWESKENRKRTVALWKAIAERYRNRPYVYGYEILNEPDVSDWKELLGLYREITSAIRSVDSNHMIIYQGNKHGRKFHGFGAPLDSNAALSYHTYKISIFVPDITDEILQALGTLNRQHGWPYINTEFGANDLDWTRKKRIQMEGGPGQGWTFWPYKRVPSAMQDNFRHLVEIKTGEDWEMVDRSLKWPRAMSGEKEKVARALLAFLDASRAEKLVVDQEILGALGL
ncbi:MAG: cellulase family glycosylhydrolase [Leptospiraceae bacterium]|nr:cellulase family glycosylhydrolase [Leptospiraceae bacterium]